MYFIHSRLLLWITYLWCFAFCENSEARLRSGAACGGWECLGSCGYIPSGHSPQICGHFGARSVCLWVFFSLGKSLLHWSEEEVTPVEFCFCFSMLEKLLKGEHKYWSQPDSLYAPLPKVQGTYSLCLCGQGTDEKWRFQDPRPPWALYKFCQ